MVSVTHIKKTKTAILVPNALVIATANDRVRASTLQAALRKFTLSLNEVKDQLVHFPVNKLGSSLMVSYFKTNSLWFPILNKSHLEKKITSDFI